MTWDNMMIRHDTIRYHRIRIGGSERGMGKAAAAEAKGRRRIGRAAASK